MKTLLTLAIAGAFVASLMGVPSAGAAPRAGAASRSQAALPAQVRALQRQVKTLRRQVAELRRNQATLRAISSCAFAITFDAVHRTWGVIDTIAGRAIFGPQTRLEDRGACAALGITREPAAVGARSSLLDFLSEKWRRLL